MNEFKPNTSTKWISGLLIFAVLMGCMVLVCGIGSGFFLWQFLTEQGNPTSEPLPLSTVAFPTVGPSQIVSTQPAKTLTAQTPGTISTPLATAAPISSETLRTLENAVVPPNDPEDLARRLKGVTVFPPVQSVPVGGFKAGDEIDYWVINGDTDVHFKAKVVLAYAGKWGYIWIQKGLNYDAALLDRLGKLFDAEIYPTNTQFFGSEWSPGIDGDPHLYIVYVKGLGKRIAGYFSSGDSVNPAAYIYSSAHETFMVNADLVTLDESYFRSVLAHEHQHMIHWYTDRNEESWVNEGLSEMASVLNDAETNGSEFTFARQPDMQLNDWPNDSNATFPHYGAAYLFLTYFSERFGSSAVQQLVGLPENGMEGIDTVLTGLGAKNADTGAALTAEDVFADWVVTNYLNDPKVDNGQYAYKTVNPAPKFNPTDTVRTCPLDWQSRTVSQFGADYFLIKCRGQFALSFAGQTQVGVLKENARSGKYYLWSNKGDESDMRLKQQFDFSAVKGALSLKFDTWYDLEKSYDFAYILYSEDGQTWTQLKTSRMTDDNKTGNNYGWGYSGESGGWVSELVDLSALAGKKVWLGFEYVTDAAVNGEGLLLDNIAIPQAGYASDFEKDLGGWQAEGFVRMDNVLRQTYAISLIELGAQPVIRHLSVDAMGLINLPVNLQNDAVLVVSGTTRFTRVNSNYKVKIAK